MAECAEPLGAADMAAAGVVDGKTTGVGVPMANLSLVCSDGVSILEVATSALIERSHTGTAI